MTAAGTACFHCGTPCPTGEFSAAEKSFCCAGCRTVYEILTENGLANFYQLSENAGVRVKAVGTQNAFAFLDDPQVAVQLVDFQDAKTTRVTLRLPAIHCIACVWLLENLFRLRAGIGASTVNFTRKEISVTFAPTEVKLSEVVALLASLGYEPDLKFSDLAATKSPVSRRLWLQLGVAGFAFGNNMLFSISGYLGVDTAQFKNLFGLLSFLLALPVFFYSAADYWRASWLSLRRGLLTIEVPIAAGIVALFGQSVYEVATGRGEGYFDSLCGLIFFLLCGKLFQQKTFDRLAFDRDYKSFFPLAVTRKTDGAGEEQASLSQLRVGDRLLIRNGELIPADGQIVAGEGMIDYSFVTGEAAPEPRQTGEHLYAGGRQTGGAIEMVMTKAVSQSYLTSLWNQDALLQDKPETIATLTNVYSYRFTKLILAIAVGAALYWLWADASLAGKAFTSVLIVACPCALALAAPFALGTALRVLGHRNVFLKNPGVIETLAQVDSIIFDKTGTLTAVGGDAVTFVGEPLNKEEARTVLSLCRHSTHPHAVRLAEHFAARALLPVRSYEEITGRGVSGLIGGQTMLIGSAAWLREQGVADLAAAATMAGSASHLAIQGKYRGTFRFADALRPQTGAMILQLADRYELALLSGDNERERARFSEIFGPHATLQFHQTPASKFEYVEARRNAGKTVMMVGDGLNDAGALKNAAVGVAVVESIHAFSPASDIIMGATMVPQLPQVMAFSRAAVRTVRLSFLISSVYNVVGIGIAASGKLSPVVCAVLMPLSSVTVVAFACGLTAWQGRRIFGDKTAGRSGPPSVETVRIVPAKTAVTGEAA